MDEIEELKALLIEANARGQKDVAIAIMNKLDALESGAPDLGAVGNVAAEFGAGVNRGVGDLADFWTTDPVNVVTQRGINPALEAAGVDYQIPRMGGAREALDEMGATQGGFMDKGMARDIVGGAGEVAPAAVNIGGAMRYGAKALPAMTGGEGVATGVARQMGRGTAAGDVGYGAASVAGEEVGGQSAEWAFGQGAGKYGEAIGSILAPTATASMMKPLTYIFASGADGIKSFLANKPAGMSDEGLATLMSEAMVREGISPDEAVKRLQSLGSEGLPADIGNNFMRLLRLSANKLPRVQGEAVNVLDARQRGSGNRLLNALDDSSGTSQLSLGDEIARIDQVMKPRIKQLYDATSDQGMELSHQLKAWISDGKNSIGRAQKEVQKRLADKRSLGEEVTNIDIIDTTKQVLDDQIGKAIRSGNMNKARDLVRMKNAMVDEADAAIPVYRAARDMHAGKVALENAGDLGTLFFKMKPREMVAFTQTMSQSEKKMFKLGAKQAIMDKVDDISANADQVKRLFGKNGDVYKLRELFDTEDQFKQFRDTLRREARFAVTRRAIEGNSTTAQQLSDETSWSEKFTEVMRATSNPRDAGALLNKILVGLHAKKGTDEYIDSLSRAGYLLANKDVDIGYLTKLLRSGNAKEISRRVREALKEPLEAPYAAGTAANINQNINE